MVNPHRWLPPALILLAGLLSPPASAGEGCTTAVISANGTPDGRPLLWKNRDTDVLSNKVLFVDENPYNYLAVINAEDSSGRIAWGGLNEAGFAIINSVAYNLPSPSGEMQDLEGILMGDALRTCATVDDFERYLRRNLGPSLGARTNFCVIDAHGGASIFEVYNHGFHRLNADTTVQACLLNTNFSRNGITDAGAGYLRFDREQVLFSRVPKGKITLEFVLQTAARDVGHALLRTPERETWRTLPADTAYWIHTNHTINRPITASTILVQGVKPGEDPRYATLWVVLGEPLCSIAVPLWVAAGQTPPEVREGTNAPLYNESVRLQKSLRPLPGNDRHEYIDITHLDNRAGTGWLPRTLTAERETINAARTLLERRPAAADLASFEKEAARKALTVLGEIR